MEEERRHEGSLRRYDTSVDEMAVRRPVRDKAKSEVSGESEDEEGTRERGEESTVGRWKVARSVLVCVGEGERRDAEHNLVVVGGRW